MKNVTEFTVKRSEWATPDKQGGKLANLLGYNGLKCCLGFWCSACGCSDNSILGVLFPRSVLGFDAGIMRDGTDNSKLALEAACINDNTAIDNAQREIQLAELFAAHNIKINFVD